MGQRKDGQNLHSGSRILVAKTGRLARCQRCAHFFGRQLVLRLSSLREAWTVRAPSLIDGDFCAAGASCFACSRTAESRRPGRLLPRQSLRPVPPSLSWSCVALYLFVLQFDKPSGEVVVCLPKIRHSMATVSNHTHTCTQAFVHKYSDMLAYAYVHLLMLNIVFQSIMIL